MGLKSRVRTATKADAIKQLEQRVADLEGDLSQVRRQHLRLAELADIVEELVIPIASRDEAAIERAIERFRKSL